ncbi:MAG TPA: small multi-drug export protein [Geobacterales bacterium]|nr:small multi-drug export protein [Geobacterales bacterium]
MLSEIITIIILTLTGELIVALPAALVLGMDPLQALTIVVLTNIFPSIPIFKFFNFLNKKENKFVKFLMKRGEYLKNKGGKGIDVTVLLITPLIGVYAISIILAFMKISSVKGIALQLLSLLIWGSVIIVSYLLIKTSFVA